ncbi:MAG: hypothetical protein IPN17_07535 [Deltaproteobacteria bacterium]|nr:hypothetical protein [Deltaproteobacteria bacterium]
MKAPVSLAWHEFAHAHFGHWARTTRVMQMWERLSSHPSGTVSAVFEVPAERKGAYRFLESPKVRWEPLAEAVHVATARRCSRHALVIGIVDGSSIAHTDRRGDDGVGSVGSRRMGGRGIKSMILLAASFDGVPLGVGAHAALVEARHPLRRRTLCAPRGEGEPSLDGAARGVRVGSSGRRRGHTGLVSDRSRRGRQPRSAARRRARPDGDRSLEQGPPRQRPHAPSRAPQAPRSHRVGARSCGDLHRGAPGSQENSPHRPSRVAHRGRGLRAASAVVQEAARRGSRDGGAGP